MAIHLSNISQCKENEEEELWPPFSDISSSSGGSSSTFSWTDEADISIARELQEQFQKFEEALYLEGSPYDLPQSLQDEVKIWTEYSPHIRIRGFQAKLHERSENEKDVNDQYDINFEEVIDIHDSLESSNYSVTTDINDNISLSVNPDLEKHFNNTAVCSVLENNCSKVREKVEAIIKSISAGKSKPFPEKLRNNLECASGKSQKVLSRSNSSRSHKRNLSPRKPNIDDIKYTCALSSRSVRPSNDSSCYGPSPGKVLYRVPRTSLPKVKINRVATFSAKHPEYPFRPQPTQSMKNKVHSTDKTIILPPIEALAITPKKPDKRANSAMVRFTKTLPRVRPNSAQKKNLVNKTNTGRNKEMKKVNSRSEKVIEESDCNITLEVIGIKSNTTDRNCR